MENSRVTEPVICAAAGIVCYEANPPTVLQNVIVTWNGGNEAPQSGPASTFNPGAALYIGAAMTSITLVMESGNVTTFNNVPAGSFMPVSALTVCAAVPVDEIEPKDVILALF